MTEQEFISGMWQQVDAMAYTEAETKKALQISQRLKRRELLQTCLLVAGILGALWGALYLMQTFDNIFSIFVPLVLVALTSAYFSDSSQYTANTTFDGGTAAYG